jgi:hypothetical protein
MLTGTMFCLALNHVIGRGLHETVLLSWLLFR